ncbi:MAG: hypothetical protein HJJLKODD_01478 [Phycisphaerae bacterium]|nr:hypothetical protein [Phycisphaerae bacterium]
MLALSGNDLAYLVLLIATAVIVVIWQVLRWRESRRPPHIHPRLQKYAGPDSDLAQQRRTAAEKIIATSSTPTIAGYLILQQIEAVYVEGFRRPEEALEGIKAVAAMKGANAVINLRHERSAAGKCSASGDAVLVEAQAPSTS